MKKYILSILVFSFTLVVNAQSWNDRPMNSIEEDAQRQTEMLVREVGIQDSVQREAIYQMFLRMSTDRRRSNTRAEELQRLIQMDKDLKNILTPQQYDLFMNTQVDTRMQRPPMPFGQPPHDGEPHQCPMPPDHR